MQISDEMVEKAARAVRAARGLYGKPPPGARNDARICLEAALSGHVVVPVEPTAEQMTAAGDAVQDYAWKMMAVGGEVDAADYALRAVIYRAMVEAAVLPQLPRHKEG